MLIPKSLYLKNFLSFEEEVYNFENNETTCIMGRNLTEDAQESNGSGKSAFQTGLEFIYTGNFSRKVTKSKLVRRGQKEAELIHVAWNNVKNEFLQIERIIPVKGSEKVFVYLYSDKEKFEENKDTFEVEIATTADANKWIENYIGISKEDLMNYFLPNELTYKSFFDSSDTAKKELIGRFSNSEIVDPAFIKVQNKIDNEESVLKKLNNDLISLNSKLEIKKEDLEIEQSRDVKKENEEKVQDLKDEIKRLKDEINVLLSNIVKYNKGFKKHTKTIDKCIVAISKKTKKISEYLDSSKDFKKEYEKFETDLKLYTEKIKKANKTNGEIDEDEIDIKRDLQQVKTNLAGEIECPKCSHKFVLSENFTLEELKTQQKKYLKELDLVEEDRENTNKILEKYKNLKSKIDLKIELIENEEVEFKEGLKKLNKQLDKLNNHKSLMESSIKSLQRSVLEDNEEIESKKKSIELKKKSIEEIENSEIDKSKEKSLKKDIKEFEKEIKLKDIEIQDQTNKIEKIKEWGNNFASFKSFLANKKLKIIEGMINKYLVTLNADYQLKLEGFREIKGGKEVREKITPYIYKDGQLCDFGEFSKGERTRMNFANLLTLQTLVNETSKNGGLDVCFPDEIFEGIDSQGLGLLLDALNETGKTTLLTTHVSDDKIHDNILMIEKVNGISKIVNYDTENN